MAESLHIDLGGSSSSVDLKSLTGMINEAPTARAAQDAFTRARNLVAPSLHIGFRKPTLLGRLNPVVSWCQCRVWCRCRVVPALAGAGGPPHVVATTTTRSPPGPLPSTFSLSSCCCFSPHPHLHGHWHLQEISFRSECEQYDASIGFTTKVRAVEATVSSTNNKHAVSYGVAWRDVLPLLNAKSLYRTASSPQ